MNFKLYLFVVIALLHIFIAPPVQARENVIGYFSFWSAQKGFEVTKIEGNLLTHLIFSFLDISKEGECKILIENKEEEAFTLKIFAEMAALKTKFPTLKTIISIGGWSHSGRFSEVARTAPQREKFVKSCVSLMKKYSFDGIDVDWEYPVRGGIEKNQRHPKDGKNFTLLMAEFRKAIDTSHSLSMAVSASLWNLNDLEVQKLAPLVDWFGLMTYDFCTGESKMTCHHSALNPSGKNALNWFKNKKIKSQKIILGVPFYGYRWFVPSSRKNGLNQKVDLEKQKAAPNATLTYQQIVDRKFSSEQTHWDPLANQPWVYVKETKTMISFEDEISLRIKMNYVRKNKLGGIMIWELPNDTVDHALLKSLQFD